MKRLILILVVISTSLTFSYGQSKEDKVKTLINLMQSEKMIDKSFASMKQAFKAQANKELSKDSGQVYNEFMMNEMQVVVKQLIENDMPDIYIKYFTEKEIDALIAFYQSPAGRKLIKVTPDIQTDFVTKLMNKYIPEMQQKFTAEIEKLKQNG